jgi:hypothetical protein
MAAPGESSFSAGSSQETRLGGGRTSVGVVRIGDAVHRPVRPWTPAVHAVLRHLERVGFDGVPRVLGFDGQGREVLSWLEGETVGERRPWPTWVPSDAALVGVGAWLRRLHDATVCAAAWSWRSPPRCAGAGRGVVEAFVVAPGGSWHGRSHPSRRRAAHCDHAHRVPARAPRHGAAGGRPVPATRHRSAAAGQAPPIPQDSSPGS